MSIRDKQPWQKLPHPAAPLATTNHTDRSDPVGRTPRFSRRTFMNTAAGSAAFALAARPSLIASAHTHDDAAGHGDDRHDGDHARHHLRRTTPAPKPIPGGIDLSGFGLTPPYDFIHVFGPGEEGLVLPYTGVVLQGLNVEPGTMTDFDGFSAVAFHVGTAKGSDGKAYNLETDFRVMDGKYVAVDGTTRQGSFALI